MSEAEKERKQRREFLKQFGEHIKGIRLEKGITGAELARRCYMDKPNITRLEKGRINPSIYFLKKICEGLDVSLTDIIKGFDNKRGGKQ